MTRAPLVRLLLDDDEACIDGFAGGGGTSTGIEMALGRSPDFAINHDAEALAMHEANHPTTTHIRTNIRKVHYGELLQRGQYFGFGWFSPDCTYFSKAKGGQPFRDRNRARRIRGLAWEVVRFVIEAKRATGRPPRVVFMENVEEFKDWCPLGRDGQPDASKRGQSFRQWVGRLRGLGGVVEWRELVACNHGAPTRRKRLFVIIRFDGLPIVWPESTHGPGLQPYRTAAECIDFSLPVPSIFLTHAQAKRWAKARGLPTPHRPLARATLRRIARGVMRYVVNAPEPFIVNNLTNNVPRPVSEPLSTVLTGNHKYLVQPILTPFLTEHANANSPRVFAANEPLRTICAHPKGGHFALVVPTLVGVRAFLVKYFGTGVARPLTEPIGALTTKDRLGLVTVTIAGEEYLIVDIGMRMLTPRELFRAQGFPPTYEIEQVQMDTPLGLPAPVTLTKRAQTRLCGNSVPPHLAAALVGANLTRPVEAVA